MGRSTSCFKIITCAGGSAVDDDLQAHENTSSSDKRGWSFRKRSARHRVLSNTVITESPYSANKGSSESANLNFQSPDTSAVPEKVSVIQCTDEKPQLPTFAEPKVSETIIVAEDESKVDAQLEESLVIAIQTAVRGFLAQRELFKLKNLVKLQAAVRGHLVRRHAIGTLRCVQAIVKMQALVRARRARLLQEGLSTDNKANSKTLGKEIKPINVTYTSINKLLSNKFARQLMESTPKERPIHIKCDPAKPNSAWNWLERWMSVSSAESTPQPESRTEQLGGEKNVASQDETTVPFGGLSEIPDSESKRKTSDVLPSENEENLIIYDTNDFKFQECHPTSSLPGDDLEQPRPEEIISSDIKEPINSCPNSTTTSDVNPQMEINSLDIKEHVEGEQIDQPKRSMKRYASEPLETEGKKFVFGSRKAGNPSFIASHSKFEGLSSTANSNRVLSSSYEDNEINFEAVSSGTSTALRTKEHNAADNLVPSHFRSQHGGSECGTELSVTSTLDSPDISEIGAAEPENEHEVRTSDKETCNPDVVKDDIEGKNASSDPVPNISDSVMIQPEKHDGVRDESVDYIVAAESPNVESKPERSASDVHREMESETGGPAYRSSPEASPRSHITVPESQGTPSSQLSVSAEKNRTDKSASNQKRKSLSASKRSPLNPSNDSAGRNSTEQLPKDQKNGKRRNSFGSARCDHTDQETRDSSSNSSLPHFMQATESARAKVQANSSPRSSPDVQDGEHIKKRHSLAGANGRQGSPRVQRSISQAQPGSKGNDGIVIHEKKWQR